MKNITKLSFALSLAAAFTAYGQFAGKRVNIGSNINSAENTDSAPVITYDGKTMFFKRSVPGPEYDYDIYMSTLDANKQWTKAVPVDELNNNKISEVEYVYPDGKTMIVCGTFDGKSGIFYAFYRHGKWGHLQQIDIGKEMDANEDNVNVTMNSKQDVMIVSIHGDLYLSKNVNGKWSDAESLASLNTAGYEYTPFIDYDDKTLYIAGTGYSGNNEEADIWVVQRTDDTWKNWSQPEKVKGNINTDGWDSFFYIPPSKEFVYVYSLTEGGGDILTIKNEEKKEDPKLIDPMPIDIALTPEEQLLVDDAAKSDLEAEQQGRQYSDDVNRSSGGNMNELEEILLFPNPTSGQFSINLHNSNESTFSQVTVFDENLRPVSSIGTSQNTYNMDLSEFANGIYFVRVECNGKTSIKKVVLEK